MEQLSALEQIFPQSAQANGGKSKNQLGQEDFMKLLVAQLENQDPSKPVENGEFLAQIAQFSMVEGIGGLEQGFNSLANTLQRNQVADAAALLDRQVLFDGSSMQMQAGGSIDGEIALDTLASNVQLRVLDANGATVASENLGSRRPGNDAFSWDGMTWAGEPAPAGEYRFIATGEVNGVEQSLPLRMYGRVESVAVDPVSRELALQLEDGAILSLSQVHEFK
ncbi:MAG: flagellar hook assembly protein FlgD [Halieaceae bacterium]